MRAGDDDYRKASDVLYEPRIRFRIVDSGAKPHGDVFRFIIPRLSYSRTFVYHVASFGRCRQFVLLV